MRCQTYGYLSSRRALSAGQYLFSVPLRVGNCVGLRGWLHANFKTICPQTVTHLSTNRARRRVTSLTWLTTLPLSYTKPSHLSLLYNAAITTNARNMEHYVIMPPFWWPPRSICISLHLTPAPDYFAPGRQGCEVLWSTCLYVCLHLCLFSVCLSVCPVTYIKITRPNFTKFSAHFTCGRARGSVLRWRKCDTLCTSGFMDEVIFPINGRNRPESLTTRTFRPVHQWRHRTAKCAVRLRLHLDMLLKFN